MIGQKQIQAKLREQISNNTLAKFIMLVGDRGSGKKTLAKWLAKEMGAEVTYILPDVRVETIRQMIDDVYASTEKMVCIIPDTDGMNMAAKNALLKVTEEPPRNVWFILTVENIYNMFGTILSRATTYSMDLYTQNEILTYYKSVDSFSAKDSEIIVDLCSTPGEVDLLLKQVGGVGKFFDYVTKVVDNIALVSGSNSFKIAEKIALKDESDKYDLRLFWTAFTCICLKRLEKSPFKYAHGIQTTGRYLQDLRNPSFNKQMCFDEWLLSIREEWLDYAED